MELETVIAELKQLREDFAELKNKFESLLGQAGWQSFKYTPAPAASNVLNMFKCGVCGWFYAPGNFHVCQTNAAQPSNPFVYPTVFNSNGNVAEQNTQAVSHS